MRRPWPALGCCAREGEEEEGEEEEEEEEEIRITKVNYMLCD